MESRQIPQDLLGIDEATHSLLRVASAVFILFLAKLCRDRCSLPSGERYEGYLSVAPDLFNRKVVAGPSGGRMTTGEAG